MTFDAVEPDSREKKSESRITVAKSAIVPAAMTSCPKVEPISSASLSTGTRTPSEVADSTMATNSGCEASPPAFSASPTTIASTQRDGEAQQREPQDAPAQALEVDLQAGEEEQVGQSDGREDLHGVVHVDPPEHRGPHDDPEHDLDHDRRDAHGRHEAERRAARRSRSRRR